MPSDGRPGVLYNGFIGADLLIKERLFGLSCFDISHWEDEPNWSIDQDVEEKFLDTCETIMDRGDWRRFVGKIGEDWVEDALYRGILSNHLLAWHVSSKLGYRVDFERMTGGLDHFDVLIIKDEIPYCVIEIKRLGSTNSIDTEVQAHIENCKEYSNADFSVLFCYFPIGKDERSHRVNDYLKGYIYSYSENIGFFDSTDNFISTIPAPITPTEDDITPLSRTVQILTEEVGIARR